MVDQSLDAMLREAARLRRRGNLGDAIAAYERLLARWPDLPDSWYNLGLLQRQAGQFEAALVSYQRALDRGVRDPEEVHLNRGVIYADHLRRNDAAARELMAALVRNPDYSPALLNLANLREDEGRRDEALLLYERILARDPNAHEALARCANLKSVSGADDPLVRRLREAIASPGTGAAEKASLGFVLGKLLDECGAYDAAWEAYEAANQASRESAGARGVYDRAAQDTLQQRIVRAFPEPVPASRSTGEAPIFICGMFRSGSTLAEQILSRHPRVTAGGELDILPNIVRAGFSPFPGRMAGATPAMLNDAAGRYRAELQRLFPDADRVTDKRPDNFLYLGLIKRMFPNAKIVHTTRNPLDNCLSIHFLHLDHRMAYALDLMDTGHYYRMYRRLMAHWRGLYPRDILDLHYDDLVREPRPHIERLLAFCGLEWDEACLSPHLGVGAVKTASAWQVREPLYQRSLDRSQNYQRHLEPLRKYLGL